jgi:hypothetical protein
MTAGSYIALNMAILFVTASFLEAWLSSDHLPLKEMTAFSADSFEAIN